MTLSKIAREAATKFPSNDVEAAIHFCQHAIPAESSNKDIKAFIGESNDRLVKLGRSLKSLVTLFDSGDSLDDRLEQNLALLVQECEVLLLPDVKVPKVRFGKTSLEMPIVTLGCMRFQQEWGPRITTLDMVGTDCQDNLIAILNASLQYGINHIETARGYGCSELQLGTALKQLMLQGKVRREDLIIQTKVPPNANVQDFRKALETSMANLQVDYLDLFAFHGFNFEEQVEWVFGKEGSETNKNTCYAIIQEYVKAGKIRHVGFSTHGSTDLICSLIKKDVFDYVNLHYHYFGSYTASGGGHDGKGNLEAVKLCQERDMGVFIISPFDKGGRMYEPSKKLRSLTLPDMEPMAFKCQWIWNHDKLEEGLPSIHTFTLGAARPSDLDQAVVAAHLHGTRSEETLNKTKAVVERLDQAKLEALGADWVATWWKGLPKASKCKSLVEHNQIVWIYNSIKAFGMYEFGKARYHSFENNFAKWDAKLSPEENIDKNIGKNAWGFVPGLPLTSGLDYSDELQDVPEENKLRVKEAHDFVYKWCRTKETNPEGKMKKVREQVRERITTIRRNFSVSSQNLRIPSFLLRENSSESKTETTEMKEESKQKDENEEEEIPSEWESSFDMRPWPDYPDQPSRA